MQWVRVAVAEKKRTAVIELLAWATVFVGGDGSESREFSEEILPGDTIRAVLKRHSRRHRELDKALWDRGSDALSEHIEIAVNDALLGIKHTLESEVEDGDRIILMGQYMGG